MEKNEKFGLVFLLALCLTIFLYYRKLLSFAALLLVDALAACILFISYSAEEIKEKK